MISSRPITRSSFTSLRIKVLERRRTGLPKDSVANVSQIVAVDRDVLSEHVGRVSRAQLERVLSGIDVVLGR